MTPLFEKEGFIICFDAIPEDTDKRKHFVNECGWTSKEYASIKNFAWFTAAISAWKDGKEIACSYLGCCCYKTTKEFYTTFVNDYFSDMVSEVISEAKEVKP